MSSILCVAALHLSKLCPDNPRYSAEAAKLLSTMLQSFRESLSRPFTKDNCVAIAGTTFLLQYVSWCNLDFLRTRMVEDSPATEQDSLDFSHDQLFLLCPGVIQVFFQLYL